MPALATRSLIEDTAAPSPNSLDNRRTSIRRTLSELSWLNQIRLKYGPLVSLLDLSTGGAQIETASYRLQPGSAVVVEIAAGSETFLVRSRVLRAYVSRILPSETTYRAALVFKDALDLPRLPEAGKESDRHLNLVHEHAKLNIALRRIDESTLLDGGGTRHRGWTRRRGRSARDRRITIGSGREDDLFARNEPAVPHHHHGPQPRNGPSHDPRSDARGRAARRARTGASVS